MTGRARRLARMLNPFQPIRGGFPMALAITILAAVTLRANIDGHWIPGIVIGAAESLICPVGPAAAVIARRLHGH